MTERKQDGAPKRFDVHRTLPNTDQGTITSASTEYLETGQAEDKKRWLSWKKGLLALLLILFLPIAVIGTWDYMNYAKASEKMFGSNNLLSALPPNSLESNSGRTNVLIAGFSTDDPGHAGAELTDSIMILSMDKESETGYMLSVPRDLYVDIPGYGQAKINEAYQAGKQANFQEPDYPKGGMGLLEKVISENFDINIHYYALINYGAVKDTVKALNGITVNIQSDDPRGIYDPGFLAREGNEIRLKNGPQKIDAQTALNLTRARGHGAGSYGLSQADFDRTNNQQQVLKGIKQKITWQRLLDPRKNEPLLNAVASNVKTDLEVSNVLPIYRLFNGIPDKDLKSISLREFEDNNLLASYTTPSGQSALIPATGIGDFTQIQQAIDKLNKK